MKKIFTIIILATLTLGASSSLLSAQEKKKSKKELRSENRNNDQLIREELMRQKIAEKNFTFVVDEVASTGNSEYTNIKVESLWTVTLNPQYFKCFLPINFISASSDDSEVTDELDIYCNSFTIKTKAGKRGVTNLTVIAYDTNVHNTEYTFEFKISRDGNYSQLILKNNFKEPITYIGRIDPRN